MNTTPSDLRRTGISVVGDMPWGTHFCHFYATKQDLLDTLVPYFKAGLESKEFCVWVVSDSTLISMEEAKGALAGAVPDLDRHLADEDMEILNGLDWYLEENVFNLERVTRAWDAKLKRALARGYEGMRVSGDTFWLTEKDWKDFCAYEKQLNDFITDQPMTVLCTYPLAKSAAAEILDVMDVHQFATARRQGQWQVIQSPESIHARAQVKRLNEELQKIVKQTPQRPLIMRYGVAVLAVIAALIINRLLNINLVGAPAMLFLCAVMFSAWYGGVKPGLLAMPLAALAFAYYFVIPTNSWSVDVREIPRLLLFVLSALFVISLSAAQKRASESLRRARDVLAGTVEELKRSNQALRTENTERKRAEALLHAKEQAFRAIVENAPDQIIRYDREFRRVYVNPAVAQFYDLPAEALIGKPLGSGVREADLDVKKDELAQVRERIAAVFNTGKTYDYELTWTMPTGRTYFSIRLFPELDLNGSVVNVLGISRDITERKLAEKALDERLRFETLLTELSAAFANLLPNEVDREIDKSLQTLAEFLRVDRASFFQFGEDWTRLYRSHSYTVPGIEPLPPVPMGMKDQFPWITDQLRRGITVKWSRIPDDMPEEAVKEKEYAARLRAKSGLNIPVRMGGSIICAITFTSIANYRDWPDAMVARLRLVGEIFTAAVERKRAGAALRKSEEQFRQMAENIREVFWLATADLSKMLYISPAYEAVWGQSRESLYRQPRSFFAAIHADDRSRVVEIVEKDRERGFEVEYRVVRPDGSIRWIRDRGFPIQDDSGRFYRVAGIAEDITESKCAEEELKKEKEILGKIFDNIPLLIGFVGQDGRVKLVNPEWERTMGWTLKELQEQNVDIFAEAYPDLPYRQEVLDFVAAATGEWVDLKIKIRDGRVIDAACAVVRLSDGTKVAIAQDITERKQAEEKLRQSESQLAEAQHLANIGSWSLDLSSNTVTWSDELYRIFGVQPSEFDHNYEAVIGTTHPEDREWLRSVIEHAIKTHEPFSVYYRITQTTGEVRVLHAHGAVVTDEHGNAKRLHGTAQDVTERMQAEEKLRATTEQLRALSAKLQSAKEEEGIRIARELHDEMGSTLTSLRWDLERFDKIISEAEEWSQVQVLRRKVAEMIKLTDITISTMRRIASELRPSILDDLGLPEAIEWQAHQFQNRTGIVCHCDCSLEKLDFDQEQATAIFRIFQEALTNVLSHAGATEVEVVARNGDGDFVLTISDNGRGITEDEKSGRLSLGILGMRERAHLIGGEFEIKGIEGMGTVVTVSVPISQQANLKSAP
jgi:PAS domain S-box-containing protein